MNIKLFKDVPGGWKIVVIILFCIWFSVLCFGIKTTFFQEDVIIIDNSGENIEVEKEYKYSIGMYVYENWKPGEELTPEKFFENFSLIAWYIDNEAVARIKFKDGKIEFEGNPEKVMEIMSNWSGYYLPEGYYNSGGRKSLAEKQFNRIEQ